MKEQQIAAELEKLKATGDLTPERVIELAKDPASPLCSLFQWDDLEAARLYRYITALAVIETHDA